MSDLGEVHVQIGGDEKVYPGVPYPDGADMLSVRGEPGGPVKAIAGFGDWWWVVDVELLTGEARAQANAYPDRVRKP